MQTAFDTMDMQKKFIFYRSWHEAIRLLPKEQRADAYEAIIGYALDGTEIDGLPPIPKAIFMMAKARLDANRKRRENGMKGGVPKRNAITYPEPPVPKIQEVRYSPIPTLDEIKQYFRSLRAYERISDWEKSAEKFFYHYDGLGWRNSNGGIIANWKSTAVLWVSNQENRERKAIYDYGNRQISKIRCPETETTARTAEDYKGTF